MVSQAAGAAFGSMMASYSMGVNQPRQVCRRRRWQMRSFQVRISMRMLARVAHVCRSSSLLCGVAKSDSMAAL